MTDQKHLQIRINDLSRISQNIYLRNCNVSIHDFNIRRKLLQGKNPCQLNEHKRLSYKNYLDDPYAFWDKPTAEKTLHPITNWWNRAHEFRSVI